MEAEWGANGRRRRGDGNDWKGILSKPAAAAAPDAAGVEAETEQSCRKGEGCGHDPGAGQTRVKQQQQQQQQRLGEGCDES